MTCVRLCDLIFCNLTHFKTLIYIAFIGVLFVLCERVSCFFVFSTREVCVYIFSLYVFKNGVCMFFGHTSHTFLKNSRLTLIYIAFLCVSKNVLCEQILIIWCFNPHHPLRLKTKSRKKQRFHLSSLFL